MTVYLTRVNSALMLFNLLTKRPPSSWVSLRNGQRMLTGIMKGFSKLSNLSAHPSVSREPGKLSDGLRAGGPEFDSRHGQEFCLFILASRMVLGPTQPPVQLVLGPLSQESSSRCGKWTSHLHLVSVSRMVELYLHAFIRLNGMALY
jgi:hypothetical protein